MEREPKQIKRGLEKAISAVIKHKEDYVRRPGKDFVRNRKLNMNTMMRLLISMGGSTLHKELCDWFHYTADTATVSAFVQQRGKLLPAAFETVFHSFVEECSVKKQYRGFRIFAADGSDLRLPATADNPETHIKTNETDDKGYNLAHLDAIYDLLNQVYVDASIQAKKGMSEHRALVTMVDRCTMTDKAIIIADRGYESFNNMAHIIEKGWYFAIRAKDSYGIITKTKIPDSAEFDVPMQITLTRRQTKETRELFRDNPGRYRWLPPKAVFDYIDRKSDRIYDLKFRVVRFQIAPNVVETIYTNLPVSDFSSEDIKKLYHMRWGIETSFRELKYAIGLAGFHSKKRDFMMQEVFARLTAYNFSSLLMHCQEIAHNNMRVNFTVAHLWCRQFLRGSIKEYTLLQVLRRCTSPIRPGRNFPRYQKHLSAMNLNYRMI